MSKASPNSRGWSLTLKKLSKSSKKSVSFLIITLTSVFIGTQLPKYLGRDHIIIEHVELYAPTELMPFPTHEFRQLREERGFQWYLDLLAVPETVPLFWKEQDLGNEDVQLAYRVLEGFNDWAKSGQVRMLEYEKRLQCSNTKNNRNIADIIAYAGTRTAFEIRFH